VTLYFAAPSAQARIALPDLRDRTSGTLYRVRILGIEKKCGQHFVAHLSIQNFHIYRKPKTHFRKMFLFLPYRLLLFVASSRNGKNT